MKFEAVVGNPPYHVSDGGNGASALPVYQKFVEQAQKLAPDLLSMITPARWFMGGRGLDSFRNHMLSDDRIRIIHDFPNASECFPGVEIKGGVCYFLWKREERGLCAVHAHSNGITEISQRPLLEAGMDAFIRNESQIAVLRKLNLENEKSFSQMLHAGRFYGFHTKVERYNSMEGSIQTADGKSTVPVAFQKTEEKNIKIYIHGGECWVSFMDIPRNRGAAEKYKVIIPRSGNPGGSILGKPKISEPGSCSSNTYVVAFPVGEGLSQKEAENVLVYLKTRFVRYLVAIKTSTQDMPPKAYEFVPMQDFGECWTDKRLYEKYKLTEKEIMAIQNTIPVME